MYKFHRKTPLPEPLFLIKLQVWGLQLFKKRDWHRCFPVNFVKFLRRPFFKEHLWWLLQGVLRKFAKCTWKHFCQSLFFYKVVVFWHRCFPVNFAKFLSTPFFIKHLWWLLLFSVKTVSSFCFTIFSKCIFFELSFKHFCCKCEHTLFFYIF